MRIEGKRTVTVASLCNPPRQGEVALKVTEGEDTER
jgi:hypothetical protein